MDRPTPSAAALGEIATRAGEIAVQSRKELVSELKSDGSIVTNADRAVETWLRKELPAFVTGSNVWGEEFGFEEPGAGGLWLVDPVDGTSNFNFGSPLWGVSIALMKDSKIELGAVYLPDLGELYVAERGYGAFLNGERLPLIPHGPIAEHQLVSYGESVARLCHGGVTGKMRLSGAFVIDGAFTAVQRYRGLIGLRERLYDIAASVLFGLELDADLRYADGSAFDLIELSRPVQIQKPWLIFPKESGFSIP